MENKTSKFSMLLLSFVLAVLLWMIAATQSDPMAYARFDNIPITFENTRELDANGLTVTSSNKGTLKIRIYGRSMQVKKISDSDIKAFVDFSEIKSSGSYKMDVQVEGLGEDVAIVEQTPKKIDVYVDEISSSDVNKPVFTQIGDMPDGYSVLSIESDVEYVYLTGGGSQIENVTKVIGQVDVSDKKDDFSSVVDLIAVDKNNERVDGVNVNPSVANVNVKVGKTKKVKVNPLIKGKVKDGYRMTSINSSIQEVTIVGREENIKDIDSIHTKKIDVSNATSSIEKKVGFTLPEGVIIKDDIKNTTVIISIDKNNEKTIYISSFTFKGLADDLKASVLDDKVGVILTGNNEVLAKIDESYLSGTLDVTGLGVGTFPLSVKISTKELPSGVTIKRVDKETVKVKIENKNELKNKSENTLEQE